MSKCVYMNSAQRDTYLNGGGTIEAGPFDAQLDCQQAGCNPDLRYYCFVEPVGVPKEYYCVTPQSLGTATGSPVKKFYCFASPGDYKYYCFAPPGTGTATGGGGCETTCTTCPDGACTQWSFVVDGDPVTISYLSACGWSEPPDLPYWYMYMDSGDVWLVRTTGADPTASVYFVPIGSFNCTGVNVFSYGGIGTDYGPLTLTPVAPCDCPGTSSGSGT